MGGASGTTRPDDIAFCRVCGAIASFAYDGQWLCARHKPGTQNAPTDVVVQLSRAELPLIMADLLARAERAEALLTTSETCQSCGRTWYPTTDEPCPYCEVVALRPQADAAANFAARAETAERERDAYRDACDAATDSARRADERIARLVEGAVALRADRDVLQDAYDAATNVLRAQRDAARAEVAELLPETDVGQRFRTRALRAEARLEEARLALDDLCRAQDAEDDGAELDAIARLGAAVGSFAPENALAEPPERRCECGCGLLVPSPSTPRPLPATAPVSRCPRWCRARRRPTRWASGWWRRGWRYAPKKAAGGWHGGPPS